MKPRNANSEIFRSILKRPIPPEKLKNNFLAASQMRIGHLNILGETSYSRPLHLRKNYQDENFQGVAKKWN